MTTRSIVTSQPDVACDVCSRRLLRGEQPDHFIVDGRRRVVCELCAPRATLEGWRRESDQPDLTLPPMRPRRGRGLLHRLLGRAVGGSSSSETPLERELEPTFAQHGPYDMLAEEQAPAQDHAFVLSEPVSSAPLASEYVVQAVEVFNAGEYPRRMAGVARALGAPVVSVRQAEHLDSVVRIVFAWELCWYRYEVDFGEPDLLARSAGQGTELEELAREEREGNARATDSGVVSLAQ